MVADEVLGSAGDPGQVADAELLALAQGQCDQQPGGITECFGAGGCGLGGRRVELRADGFGARQVEAEQVAAVIGDTDILTSVSALRRGSEGLFIRGDR